MDKPRSSVQQSSHLPNVSHTKPDRRITRTQHSLHVALNHLILEKGYDQSTITDITRRANVGRSTFYAHHGSKEGLLLAGLQHLRAALIAAQREAGAAGGAAACPLRFSREFFEHVHEYRKIYRALVRSESAPAVTAALKRIVADIVSAELRTLENVREVGIPREALVRFVVDAFFSVLDWWFERSPALAPAEVDTIFRRLVVPALAAMR